jgi:predicted nucleic acid-binding protein
MRFWDASAIVPLLYHDIRAETLFTLLENDGEMVVWWATPVEITSALARRERDGQFSTTAFVSIEAALQQLAASWQEILPSDAVRRTAQRLLRTHPLRAADSLQLAAAIIATDHEPGSLEFVSLDARLNEAAGREGFRITDSVREGRGVP